MSVTLPEKSKLVTTRLSSSQVRTTRVLLLRVLFVLVLTLFIFKAPNYVLARTLTERVV